MRNILKVRFSHCLSVFLLAGAAVHADPGQAFEGVLTYQLSSSGREWEVKHQIKGTSTRTDISLKGMLFQSILDLDGEIYLLDVMSKKIMPPMKGPGSFGDRPPPGGEGEERPEGEPPVGGPPPGFDHPMQMQDPAEITGEKVLWEHPGKTFQVSGTERMATLSGMEGFGTIPSEFFRQFRDLQDVAPITTATFSFYHLVPVEIHVDGDAKNKPLTMKLISVDPAELDPSAFELPSDYSLIVMPGAGGGPGGPPGGQQKKGPPPGGGGRPPAGGPPPGGGGGF